VQLLYDRRRYAEAEIALRKLSESAAGAEDFQRLAAEVAMQNRDYDRALELARKAVSAGSQDYRDHLWLGQFLSLLGRNDEAEAALRRSVQLADKVPDTWVALVQHLSRSRQVAKADLVIQEAGPKLPPEQATLIVAQCQELLGRREKAEELYKSAVRERATDTMALRAIASFYLRTGEIQRAETFFRRLLEPQLHASDADLAWARRGLAVALSTTGEYDHFREALDLIQRNQKSRGPNAEDSQAQAMVLASRASHRAEAIRLFEDLAGRKGGSGRAQGTPSRATVHAGPSVRGEWRLAGRPPDDARAAGPGAPEPVVPRPLRRLPDQTGGYFRGTALADSSGKTGAGDVSGRRDEAKGAQGPEAG
jgi:tetratricopeptide (TPR) repeat protein